MKKLETNFRHMLSRIASSSSSSLSDHIESIEYPQVLLKHLVPNEDLQLCERHSSHDKNDPSRFLGEGITFKAKLIGILEVSEARGDKMCQDALNDLKTAIRAAGEHKQRITISISIDGLRLRDEKTGDCLYHHPVHKISFIAQDMSDSRAFGYIFGSPDTGHRFFGIKTDKTASQVVISMRDLFQVVFELKKKEIEKAKHHSEQHHLKYGNTGYMDSIHFLKDENESDKSKAKYSQLLKSRCLTSKTGESTSSEYKASTSEAIADLLDLEHELNSIQQGINQMDKITPSDPFGPLSKGESYIDPFDDSFSGKMEKPVEEKIPSGVKSQTPSHQLDDASDHEKHSSFFGPPTSSKTNFFSQFSPGIVKSKADDTKWFDQETESLFNETVNVNNAEPTSSPIALNTPAPEPDQGEGKKSPIKTDLFTELDPLGTGRVKPYVDKKDFFQELKNPPKKVLKELITEVSTNESTCFYFPASFKEEEISSTAKSDCAQPSSTVDSIQGFSSTPKYAKIDPFEESDPFDKTDPFQEESFSTTVRFSSLFGSKTSTDEIFEDKMSWKFDSNEVKDDENKNSPTNLALFSSSILKVSLPPEKSDERGQFSAISAKLKSPPNSPENSKSLRKNYQMLKQTTVESVEEYSAQEEQFVSCIVMNFVGKPEQEKKSPYKEKLYSLQSPPLGRNEKPKVYSSVDISDATPDPPPRAKTSLFSIKPPPLPPKKTSQPVFKPPARPPSLEDSTFQYDYLEKKENSNKEELKCIKLKKQLFIGKSSPPCNELKKRSSDSFFPILPPPPHRKISADGSKINTARKTETKASGAAGSVLNLKLNQLDNTGLENLAITLGIPSENIYSITLQELTKMLAEKYLISETKTDKPTGENFEVDFDANFSKPEINNPTPPPSYDKYAVFKELMAKESSTSTTVQKQKDNESNNLEEGDVAKEEKTITESEKQEEDKYAALRQLSLNVQKSENFSEDLDDEDSGKKMESASCVCQEEDFSNPAINYSDIGGDTLGSQSKWAVESPSDHAKSNADKNVLERTESLDQEESRDQQLVSESSLFPLVDEFSISKKANSQKDNWATFEKSDFEETPTKKSANAFNENENSPFSSDGKEDVREIPFHWHQNTFRKRARKDVPWQDDDESWDDYSPKESYCSDESSHEDRSPDARRIDRYEKPSWNLCERPPKTDRKWNGKGNKWSHRDKWQDETEDEFEETWRKQRERISSYESDRKTNFWHNSYDNYNKHYEWYNNRSEPWDENERHIHCYTSRRKRSESDNEYRKRCDSDASDKECVWTCQKNYPDSLGRSAKQKYYNTSHSYRDCPEHCHESRTKHRKEISQKRPSSASDGKRSYEKMCSSGDYSCRGSEKNYPGKTDKDDYFRFQYSRRDSRHRGETEFSHFYSSSDKRTFGQPSKMGSRSNRGSNSGQSDAYLSPNKRNETVETKPYAFDYFEPFRENHFKHGRPENADHYHFESESGNVEKTRKKVSDQSPQDFQKTSDRRTNQWASANGKTNGGGLFSSRNTNENFAKFSDEVRTSPKKSSENRKSEKNQETSRPNAKNKPHLTMLNRQDSSAPTLRKSDSINIFSRDKDPFEGDDFFSNAS